MEEDHGGYLIVLGVRKDCNTLLTNFEARNSVQFSVFAEEWRKMKFSHMYYKKNSLAEMIEFTEESFHIVKSFLLPNESIIKRIGSLYLLYSLYSKQVIKDHVKIRFVLTEWKSLLEVVEYCKNNNHHDVVFIFSKLYNIPAFQHVFSLRPYGLERGYRKYYVKHCSIKNDILNEDGEHSKLLDPTILSELQKIESMYVKTKKILFGDADLNFINNEFCQSLSNIANEKSEDSDSEDDDDNIGTRRQDLKGRSFRRKQNSITITSPQPPKKPRRGPLDPEDRLFSAAKHRLLANEDVDDNSDSSESPEENVDAILPDIN